MYYTGTVDDLVLPKFAIYRIELGRNAEKRDECRETYEISVAKPRILFAKIVL